MSAAATLLGLGASPLAIRPQFDIRPNIRNLVNRYYPVAAHVLYFVAIEKVVAVYIEAPSEHHRDGGRNGIASVASRPHNGRKDDAKLSLSGSLSGLPFKVIVKQVAEQGTRAKGDAAHKNRNNRKQFQRLLEGGAQSYAYQHPANARKTRKASQYSPGCAEPNRQDERNSRKTSKTTRY